MPEFTTRVCGIPCICSYKWGPGYAGNREEPAWPPGVDDWELLNMKGYRMQFLENKVMQNGAEMQKLEDAMITHYHESKYEHLMDKAEYERDSRMDR